MAFATGSFFEVFVVLVAEQEREGIRLSEKVHEDLEGVTKSIEKDKKPLVFCNPYLLASIIRRVTLQESLIISVKSLTTYPLSFSLRLPDEFRNGMEWFCQCLARTVPGSWCEHGSNVKPPAACNVFRNTCRGMLLAIHPTQTLEF